MGGITNDSQIAPAASLKRKRSQKPALARTIRADKDNDVLTNGWPVWQPELR